MQRPVEQETGFFRDHRGVSTLNHTYDGYYDTVVLTRDARSHVSGGQTWPSAQCSNRTPNCHDECLECHRWMCDRCTKDIPQVLRNVCVAVPSGTGGRPIWRPNCVRAWAGKTRVTASAAGWRRGDRFRFIAQMNRFSSTLHRTQVESQWHTKCTIRECGVGG